MLSGAGPSDGTKSTVNGKWQKAEILAKWLVPVAVIFVSSQVGLVQQRYQRLAELRLAESKARNEQELEVFKLFREDLFAGEPIRNLFAIRALNILNPTLKYELMPLVKYLWYDTTRIPEVRLQAEERYVSVMTELAIVYPVEGCTVDVISAWGQTPFPGIPHYVVANYKGSDIIVDTVSVSSHGTWRLEDRPFAVLGDDSVPLDSSFEVTVCAANTRLGRNLQGIPYVYKDYTSRAVVVWRKETAAATKRSRRQ